MQLEGADGDERTRKQNQADKAKDTKAKKTTKANETDDRKRKSGETFVETFTDRLQMQLEDKDGIVSDVDPKGSAATKQGVAKGDKIISINGVPLRMLLWSYNKPKVREIQCLYKY